MAKNGQKVDLIVLLTFHCETKFMKSDTVETGMVSLAVGLHPADIDFLKNTK